MKPKEFDELIRQKFDQNDFEYSPRNWDRLADELDGRAKKRNVMMWWWVPLTGIAASVALAMGVPGLLRNTDPAKSVAKTETVREHNYASLQSAQATQDAAPLAMAYNAPVSQKHMHQAKHKLPVAAIETKKAAGKAEIAMNDAVSHDADNNKILPGRAVNLLTIGNIPSKTKEVKKPIAVVTEGYNTFKPEVIAEEKKAPKLSVILSGGLNRGNQNNGYAAGATIRRMINDKVFVEGDIAFANSSNTQSVQYLDLSTPSSGKYAKTTGGAKTASPDASKSTTSSAPDGVIREKNVDYNLSYAQVTPVIGYKIMKKMSVAAGPDFQQMLVDNRPAASTVDRRNIQEAAAFDVGLIGKTEYALTRNVKAGVSYRKGINSVITPTDKYIDRDYLQFQVKCAIFNK